jgi:hypothetical protein
MKKKLMDNNLKIFFNLSVKYPGGPVILNPMPGKPLRPGIPISPLSAKINA